MWAGTAAPPLPRRCRIPTPSSGKTVGDDGINGLAAFSLAGGDRILVGAVMTGYIFVANVTDPTNVVPIGSFRDAELLPKIFDVDVFRSPVDGDFYAVAVCPEGGESAVLASLRLTVGGGTALLPVASFAVVGHIPSHQPPRRGLHSDAGENGEGWTFRGCNRVRVRTGADGTVAAYFSCFGSGSVVVATANLTGGSAPVLTHVAPFPPTQPTGMLVVGSALFVAGGRAILAYNVTDPLTPLTPVATCGDDACGAVMRFDGQNAHGVAHVRLGDGTHVLFPTAQIGNDVGAIAVRNPALAALMNQ